MTSNKIYRKLSSLSAICDGWKRGGEKIVFTNGCFDLIHMGHVDYLEKARALGNRLIIGLNTDKSISTIKGPNRPIVDENARARVLAAMCFVDAVIFFDEPTPINLITTICPDILVKGNDYSVETIVGADFVIRNGGEVKTIELVEGYSTTSIIEKIRKE